MFNVRAQIKGLGNRTRVLYSTNNLQDAIEYEKKLKQIDTIVLTIITQKNEKSCGQQTATILKEERKKENV